MTWLKRSAGTAVTGVVLAIAGCGTPGPPLPPSLNLPDRVDDLSATRAGNQVRLTWTMPKRNTDKLSLKSGVAARIWRSEDGNPSAPVASLSFAPGATASFSDSLPAPLTSGTPRPLSYVVELDNRNGRSAGPSNAAVVLAGEAPSPIAGLAAEVHKNGVILRWAAGDARNAIRIHRMLLTPHPPPAHEGALAPAPQAVDQNLLVASDTGRALDAGITIGDSYEYRTQRVAGIEIDGRTVELAGEVSAPIRVDVRDVFPPAVPRDLAAVATAGSSGAPVSIDLNWEPDTELDIAGYFVYRRENEASWQRVSGERPVAGPAFHDAHVQPGHTYHYAVSAVDRGSHQSERSAEAQETVPNP